NVYVTPKKGILDPQGKAVEAALHSLGYKNVANVKVGKFIELEITGKPSDKEMGKQIEAMGKKLLSNPVIEDFIFEIEE
ncbi:MAG: phosphoribosylformylglycinamidine synthase subunit PurS, partial [Candidatus Margulisbacteria bacterium]|nr:phosphoribosylformylglycinamidine synthase subunit PurS [Candidatus Margulisiibacteriota bacterium]